jgi:ABC-2 type transport system ATP-binding protein
MSIWPLMTNEPLISVANLTKRFGSRNETALNNLSFDVQVGGVTGLVGPDGAGKTTLLRVLAGLLTRTKGELRVCGLDPQKNGAQLHTQLSYMPQRFGLYEDLTVLENLNLYADLRELGTGQRRDRFDVLLEFTGLAPFTDRLAGALSGGMKQKLGLACSLVRKPKLLLLDEPSVGVDPISRRELWRMVKDLVDDGIGVVWSTAYLDEAELCDRVIVLSEGRTIFDGSPAMMTQPLADRTFHLVGLNHRRRRVLEDLLVRPEIVDGVIEGDNLRLVLSDPVASRPLAEEFPDVSLSPTPPRFEDAFMDRLGGARQSRSPFRKLSKIIQPENGTVIRSNALTKKFGSFTAARDISFEIERGEIYGLIGPNGAGKSTTFKMMCGLLEPSSGTATIAGYDLGQSPSQARGRLGYMAQRFSLYADLSVHQNLEFFAGVYGLTGRSRQNAIDEMITTFDLTSIKEKNAGIIPLGHKQRLALACALMHQPDVLFLDEPTSGVDPRTRREFWSHINALSDNGTTVVVTTHFMEEAEYCDRVGLIFAGHMIAEGSPAELKLHAGNSEMTLEEAFIELVTTSSSLPEATAS